MKLWFSFKHQSASQLCVIVLLDHCLLSLKPQGTMNCRIASSLYRNKNTWTQLVRSAQNYLPMSEYLETSRSMCSQSSYTRGKMQEVLTLTVLVATIDAQWEGMGDVGSVRYEPALLPPCPTIRVLSYSNCERSTHSISKWIFRNLALQGLILMSA